MYSSHSLVWKQCRTWMQTTVINVKSLPTKYSPIIGFPGYCMFGVISWNRGRRLSSWTWMKISEIGYFAKIWNLYIFIWVWRKGTIKWFESNSNPCFESWITFGNTKIKISEIFQGFRSIRNPFAEVEKWNKTAV